MAQITKEGASEIAQRHDGGKELEVFGITDTLPSNCNIYNPAKDCWFILCSYEHPEGEPGLHGSRLICVSKSTGRIVYDGSAHDEG